MEATEIDTGNKFFVGTGRDGGVTIMKPAQGSISKDDALNLAAWIVAIIGEKERFTLVLDAIEDC